jgi:hypothetical protein
MSSGAITRLASNATDYTAALAFAGLTEEAGLSRLNAAARPVANYLT